ncbi:Uncharacterised protein [Vibrio cholerae]|nr:Uncharacterised protein [Vibrio cholerae]CSB70342.1 Uncharacterised protein [Vibrio cholerae]
MTLHVHAADYWQHHHCERSTPLDLNRAVQSEYALRLGYREPKLSVQEFGSPPTQSQHQTDKSCSVSRFLYVL